MKAAAAGRPRRDRAGVRLAVLDDNAHVRFRGRIHATDATFHRFLSAILDVQGVAEITHLTPVREVGSPPPGDDLDPRIRVIATAPFEGIRGYLRSSPRIVATNIHPVAAAVRRADLVCLKLPASNALLVAATAVLLRRRRFGWVAGSVRRVVGGQDRLGLEGLAARLVAAMYDGMTGLATLGDDSVLVGAALDRGGLVTSLVEAGELRDRAGESWPSRPPRIHLAWAGRVARGKGLETLLGAVRELLVDGADAWLDILGDGPARSTLTAWAQVVGIHERVSWAGFIADRSRYLERLGDADIFVFPSPAEGFPKAILDAMAVGVPVIASPSGTLAEISDGRLFVAVPAGDASAIAAAVRGIIAAPDRIRPLQRAGHAFAAAHTRTAEAQRLVARWRASYPELPWP